MCSVAGCIKPSGAGAGRYALSFTTLCSRHRSRDRRHGDPRQEPVLMAHLTPYLDSLKRRQTLHPNAAAWPALEARWMGLVKACQNTLTVYAGGTPMIRWDVEAAREIVKVSTGATSQAAWGTALAVVMMREADSRRFHSERAFRTQLGRLVRQLTVANKGSYWSPNEGRIKSVYADPSPRAAVVVGNLLAETFGVAGVYLAKQDRVEADAKAAEREAFYVALRGVTPDAAP